MQCDEKVYGLNVYLKTLSGNIDFNLYLMWLKDPDVNKFLEVRYSLPKKINDLKSYVKKQNNSIDSLLLGIFKKDNTFIGTIRISNIDQNHKTCYLGFMIGDKSQHKKGYGFDSVNAAIHYLDKKLKMRKIYSVCYSDNISSSNLLKKLEFKLAASLNMHWVIDKKFNDQLIYEKFL